MRPVDTAKVVTVMEDELVLSQRAKDHLPEAAGVCPSHLVPDRPTLTQVGHMWGNSSIPVNIGFKPGEIFLPSPGECLGPTSVGAMFNLGPRPLNRFPTLDTELGSPTRFALVSTEVGAVHSGFTLNRVRATRFCTKR